MDIEKVQSNQGLTITHAHTPSHTKLSNQIMVFQMYFIATMTKDDYFE